MGKEVLEAQLSVGPVDQALRHPECWIIPVALDFAEVAWIDAHAGSELVSDKAVAAPPDDKGVHFHRCDPKATILGCLQEIDEVLYLSCCAI